MLQGLILDLRFALRNLRRQPAFSTLVIAAIALGVGAAVAIFSVLWSVALRPLPWPDPDSLVSFSETTMDDQGLGGGGAFMLHRVREFEERTRSFDGVAAYMGASYALTGREEPVPVEGVRATPDLFRVLRLSAEHGRLFENEEVAAGDERLAILSHSAFDRYFGGDTSRIGGPIELDGDVYTLLGVLPPGAYFPDPSTEVYVPLWWRPSPDPGEEREMMLPVVGRLAEGVTIEQARAEGDILLKELVKERFQSRQLRRAQLESAEGAGDGTSAGAGEERRVVRGDGSEGPADEASADQAEEQGRRVVRRAVREGGPEDGQPGTAPEHSTGDVDMAAGPHGGAPASDGELPHGRAPNADRGGAGERRVTHGGPEIPDARFELATLLDQQLEPARPALRMLVGAVGLVLLIACANVANLLLTRGVQRRRELATRAALGAGRAGLGRLLFIESLVLSVIGGTVGVALAWGAIRLVRAFDPGDLPRLAEIALEPSVVVFAVGLTLLAAVVFGLVPTLQTSFTRLTGSLGRDGARVGSGFGIFGGSSLQSLLRGGLAVVEVALALVLLIGAGLLARSFYQLSQEDPGYDPDGVLTAAVAPPPSRYPAGEARNAYFRQLLERLRETPGVESAAAVNFLPLFQGRIVLSTMIEGQAPPSDPRDAPQGDLRVVTDDYFDTMGLDVVAGRAFDDTDRAGGPPRVIVNQRFVDRFLEADRAVGTRLANFGEIVGVVSDVRSQGLDTEPTPMFYLPIEQAPPMMSEIFSRMFLVIRGEDPEALVPATRTAVQAIDPSVALENVRTMDERLSESVAQPRFYALVLTVFAALSLVLAVVGVYGVLSFAVSQETRETGIRMALGAERTTVLRRTLLRGLRLTLVGVILGLAGTLVAVRLLAAGLEGMLYQLEPTDPATFVALAVLLLATALLACWVPARRAAAADPVVALRHE